ncbi:MAG TPA: hypothetical protein VF558_03380 [Rubrobacteraceae bacterium]
MILDSGRGAGLVGHNRTSLRVVAICFASIVFDGYDPIFYDRHGDARGPPSAHCHVL